MRKLRVLIAEDSEDDTLLSADELRRAGFELSCRRVETEEEMSRALEESDWDLVLSDFSMPQFDGLSALRLLRASRQPDLPFIIVSGSIGEVRAVEALKEGAGNYVMKENIEKLVPVVERELRDARTRKERSEAFESLRKAVRVRDEFLSIASHELKTPLTSLKLQLQSMRQPIEELGDVGSALASKLDVSLKQVDRLDDLFSTLLDVSQINSDRLVLELEHVDLAELVRQSAARLEGVRRASGSALRVNAAEPVLGWFDARRMESATTKLLGNAFKFGLGKPVEVSVTKREGVARLVVTDHGIGIPVEDRSRIFERFERAVPENHYGGFGVGLWVVRQTVDAHRGTVRIEGEPGEGTTFVVEVPLDGRP